METDPLKPAGADALIGPHSILLLLKPALYFLARRLFGEGIATTGIKG